MKPVHFTTAVIAYTGALGLFVGFVAGTYVEPSSGTIREWISALSGWVAGIAAGGTILVLLLQLRDQRHQTNFITGNMPLELAWEQDSEFAVFDIHDWMHLYVINHGIRPVRIVRIDLVGGPSDLAMQIQYSRDNGDKRGIRAVGLPERHPGRCFRKTLPIQGWYDRGTPPPKRSFKICLSRTENAELAIEGNEVFDIRLEYLVLGPEPLRRTSTITVDIQNFLHRDEPGTYLVDD